MSENVATVSKHRLHTGLVFSSGVNTQTRTDVEDTIVTGVSKRWIANYNFFKLHSLNVEATENGVIIWGGGDMLTDSMAHLELHGLY